ncbi:MAG TPA: tyrosine-type recombinase/integrase [Xanthobacteraceae bacterium]|nr:tyrosine-type recombinase/integrase [Xanthobacteraceae bacterium]
MRTSKLSKRVVDALPTRTAAYIAYDSSLAGFGCRVTPNGTKSWIVEFRPHCGGRRTAKTRITLGKISAVTADAARHATQEILARVRLGEDVGAERAALRRAPTVAELAERYMAEEIRPMRKPRTAVLYEAYFRLHILPELGSKRTRDLTRGEVAELHRKIGARTPAAANRVLTLLSGLFSWAAKIGAIPEGLTPTKGITKYREEGRERYLTVEELGRLGDALREAETVGIPWHVDETKPTAKHAPRPENRRVKISPAATAATAAIRLLLFTGCRLREILHLQWGEVDFDRGMLFLADSKTGRKPVILSSAALVVLSGLPRTSKFVIVGANPFRPRHDLQKPWATLTKRAGLEGVRLHDLRHSFAAVGAGSGLGLPVIGKLLGHRNLETTARYAHVDASPLRIAANRIADQLASALG